MSHRPRSREAAPGLPLFTIFERPEDYPDSFVVRRFTVRRGDPRPDADPWCIAPTLERARASLPEDACVRFGRSPDDAPSIVETWC